MIITNENHANVNVVKKISKNMIYVKISKIMNILVAKSIIMNVGVTMLSELGVITIRIENVTDIMENFFLEYQPKIISI